MLDFFEATVNLVPKDVLFILGNQYIIGSDLSISLMLSFSLMFSDLSISLTFYNNLYLLELFIRCNV